MATVRSAREPVTRQEPNRLVHQVGVEVPRALCAYRCYDIIIGGIRPNSSVKVWQLDRKCYHTCFDSCDGDKTPVPRPLKRNPTRLVPPLSSIHSAILCLLDFVSPQPTRHLKTGAGGPCEALAGILGTGLDVVEELGRVLDPCFFEKERHRLVMECDERWGGGVRERDSFIYLF